MADTSTLQPLSRRERMELSPDTDRDLLDQARERFALAEEAEADERAQQLDALKFRAGDHWPAALRQDNMGEASEQLTMVIDRLNPMIQQTINAYRKSPLAMRVRPKGGGASKQVADMIEGHLRDIEQQSEAEIAYTIALDQAVGQGLGYFRLVREYEDERVLSAGPAYPPDLQPLRRLLRPCQRAPGRPGPGVGLYHRPLAHVQVYAVVRSLPARTDAVLWHGHDLAHGRAGATGRVLLQDLRDAGAGAAAQQHGAAHEGHDRTMDPTWPTREARIPTVHWCKMAGNAVLERTVWPGKYIPLIRVEGQRLNVNGEDKRTGMVQAGRDAQVSVDVYSTMEATAIMAAPKVALAAVRRAD